jgi:hypothetical protein
LTRTVPKVYVTRFFQLITTRQFAEAERILERLKLKIDMSERNRGYFQALYGMLLAQRNNDDRYAFLSNLNIEDKKELHSYRREFFRQSEHRLHADYDRGFFSAWADYMRILPKLESTTIAIANRDTAEKKIEATETERAESKDHEKEMRIDAKIAKIEEVTETEGAKNSERRQSTLADFSK